MCVCMCVCENGVCLFVSSVTHVNLTWMFHVTCVCLCLCPSARMPVNGTALQICRHPGGSDDKEGGGREGREGRTSTVGRENLSKNEQRIMAHRIVFPRDLAVEECATHSSTQQHTSTHCTIPAGTLKLCDTQQRTDCFVISRDMAVEECAHRLLSLLLKEVGEEGRQTQENEGKEGWIGIWVKWE